MCCRAETKGKSTARRRPGAWCDAGRARLVRHDRVHAGRERAGHMRGMRAGGASSPWARRDHFPPTRPFETCEHVPSAHDPSGTCEDVPSAQDPSSVRGLFPRGIPLIPLNPAESHLKLVFRSDREPAHVDGMHVGREETGVGVLCCEIALAGERSEPPGSGICAAIPNGVESASFGCRKPGSTGPATARYLPPATL